MTQPSTSFFFRSLRNAAVALLGYTVLGGASFAQAADLLTLPPNIADSMCEDTDDILLNDNTIAVAQANPERFSAEIVAAFKKEAELVQGRLALAITLLDLEDKLEEKCTRRTDLREGGENVVPWEKRLKRQGCPEVKRTYDEATTQDQRFAKAIKSLLATKFRGGNLSAQELKLDDGILAACTAREGLKNTTFLTPPRKPTATPSGKPRAFHVHLPPPP